MSFKVVSNGGEESNTLFNNIRLHMAVTFVLKLKVGMICASLKSGLTRNYPDSGQFCFSFDTKLTSKYRMFIRPELIETTSFRPFTHGEAAGQS